MTLPDSGKARLYPAVLFLLTLALLVRVLFFDFVDLDDLQVAQSPFIQSLSPARLFSVFFVTSYYPVRLFSLALDRALFGSGPMGFHAVNLLLHAGNALLLFFLVLRLSGGDARARSQAFWAGALFAFHPSAAATTAWVPGREELLSLFFILACVNALWSADHGPRPRLSLALAWVLGAAACLSGIQGVLVVVPALALARLHGPGRRWSQDLARLSPLFAAAGLALLLKLLSAVVLLPDPGQGVADWAGRVLALVPDPGAWRGGLSLAEPRAHAGRLSLFLGLLGWNALHLAAPVWLPGMYPETFSPWPAWAPAGVAAAIALALGMRLARKDRLLVFALVWLAVGLVLASNLFPHHVLRAERTLYFPLAGLAVAAVRAAHRAGRDRLLLPFLAATLAMLATLSVGAWKDGESLWTRSLAHYGDNPVGHHHLGVNLMRQGRTREALVYHAKSFSLYEGYNPLYTRFLNHLMDLRDLDNAEAYARMGLFIHPEDGRWANNLALVLAARGQVRAAAGELMKFLESKPNDVPVLLSLAILNHRLGDAEEAARCLGQARRLAPDNPDLPRVEALLSARPAPAPLPKVP